MFHRVCVNGLNNAGDTLLVAMAVVMVTGTVTGIVLSSPTEYGFNSKNMISCPSDSQISYTLPHSTSPPLPSVGSTAFSGA